MNKPAPKEALRELSRAGEAYRFLLSERDLAVLVLSETVEDCNQAACDLFGVTRDEFIGRSPLEFAPASQPDGSPSEASSRERLASALGGLPQWCTWQYRRSDGRLIDTIVHVEGVRVDGFRRVLIRIRDVSRLERAEDALAENETRMKQILDNTTTAIVFAKDLAGRYLFVNRAFERIVGLPQREIVGRTTNDLFPAETAAALMGNDARVIAAGNTITVEEEVHIGGRTRALLTNKFPLFDSRGQPYAMCGIAADITDRKRSEDALKRASLAVSAAGGVKGLEGLVEHLSAVLETDVAFVSVFTDPARNRMRTLAAWLDGRLLRSYEYDLADSPCAGIIGRVFRFVPSGALSEIPPGTMFHAKGMDGYAAYALADSAGAPIGLIAVMNRAPLTRSEHVEAILKIFAVRAAAEIERSRNEEALRRAALAVSVAGGEGVFRELVDALARILGVEIAFVALHKPGTARMLKMLALRIDGQTVENFEYPLAGTPCETVVGQQYRAYPTRLGEQFPMGAEFTGMGVQSYAGLPLADAHGNSLGILSVMSRRPLPNPDLVESMLKIFAARAVTEIERARADAALRASEAQYRAIFNGSADALVLWNSSLQRVDVNPAYEHIYGYSREEVLGGAYLEAPSPEEAERRLGMMRRTLAGEPWQAELESVRKNGEHVHVEVRTMPIQYLGEPHALAIVRDVTERRRAEAAVLASEEQYRAIFNASADGLALFDSEARIVDTNPAFAELFGYSREALRTMSPKDLVAPASLEVCSQVLAVAAEGGGFQGECRARRSDGAEFDVELRGVPMQYMGQPHRLVVVRDVTERKRADEELRQSETRYRLLFEMESDAIILVDVGTLRILDANHAAADLYRCTRDELLALKATDLSCEPDDTAASIHRHSGILRVPLRRHRRKDGSEILVEIASNLFYLSGRKTVLAAIRDITERRRAIEALQSSEEQYRAIFNASTDALVLWNPELRRVDINPAYERMYGFTRDEVLGETYPSHLPSEAIEERKELIRRTLAGEPCHAELESIRKDGGRFHIEVDTIPIRYRGEPHVLSIVRDITERKRAEEERSRLEAQLRQAQKMEAIGQLTGGIAHDFNNILTSILGYIVLGAERQSALGDAKLGRYLDQAQLAAQRARDLIQQMLTFSRGRRGERRAVSLAPLVEESARLLRPSLPATIELETDLAIDVPVVMSDPVQLEQVLLNLCINARDAMAGAGVIRVGVREVDSTDAVCASCRQRVAGRLVELSVADVGMGIAPDVLDRMFEPFFTTKEVGRGSGMGLAMVHGIVHEHGGHIVVDTAPGRGTTFRLRFMPLEEVRPPVSAAADEQMSRSPRPRLAGRVLVVDDEEMVGDFMAEMLANWGLEVTVKRNPIEAEVWYAHDPSRVDLVITDQTMPRLTGVELAKRLTGVRPDLPVILYTGFSDAVTDAAMAHSGVCALIKKPVDTEKLLKLLRAHLPDGGPAAEPGRAPPRAVAPSPRRKPSAKKSRVAPRKAPARKRPAASRRAAR